MKLEGIFPTLRDGGCLVAVPHPEQLPNIPQTSGCQLEACKAAQLVQLKCARTGKLRKTGLLFFERTMLSSLTFPKGPRVATGRATQGLREAQTCVFTGASNYVSSAESRQVPGWSLAGGELESSP